MIAVAVLILLASMGASWGCRALLLRRLEVRHPQAFADLGFPTTRLLNSLKPGHSDTQVRFWKFLWSRAVLQLPDPVVPLLVLVARAADIGLAIAVVLLFWSASRPRL